MNEEGSQDKNRPGRDNQTQGIRVKVGFEGQPQQDIKLTAYAFDRTGNLIASAPVTGEHAQLALRPDQARYARIFVAPPPPTKTKPERMTLKDMERLNAYEPFWKFNREASVQEILGIPENYWKCWLLCKCRVRGRVVRPITIGGTTTELPICHARVHICEVDPLPIIIWRLPDDLVYRLRDDLIYLVEQPVRFPIPLPDPPPFKYDTRVVDPSPENIARMNRARLSSAAGGIASRLDAVALNPQPEPPGRPGRLQIGAISEMASRFDAVALNPQPLPPREMSSLQTGTRSQQMMSSPMKLETRAALMSSSTNLVRQALVDNVQLLRPYLCYWDWLWWWYRCDELDVLETDAQGRFDTTIWYACCYDQPDLYFWVEYSIGGVWTPVYKPSIPCHTYWDYACGSEVTIHVTDPRAIPCGGEPDLTGMQVAVLSVGDVVSMHEIRDYSGANPAIDPLAGLTTDDPPRPFGGILEPRVWFSRAALIAAGITHYRWSYMRLTQSNGTTPVSDSWHSIGATVVRHYSVIDSGGNLSFPAYPLGPVPEFPGQDLFKIQPIDPPSPGIDWSAIDAHEDLSSAHFLSHLLEGGDAALAAGKYRLKLELFRIVGGAPQLVDLTAAGVALKVATTDAPFGTQTVATAVPGEHYLIRDSSPPHNVIGFQMVLRVDNNPCTAEIHQISDASAGHLTVDANCGFIEYNPAFDHNNDVHLEFKAAHPHNFATFGFTIYRGASNYVSSASAATSGNQTVASSPVDGFTRDPSSVYSKNVSVHTLLTENKPPGSPDCTKAAFAMNLSVYALATDGWSQLSGLNASGLPTAFALAPHTP
ncbi:MAG: hypothetical protein AUG51_03690 [Acidobacteria bacterium 13_1_20CM_3_53_8]|nr:MAG: hypothetical protein AUG51_03690 [Acidobacteria bacterium 13_1_20CM_3_53_8]